MREITKTQFDKEIMHLFIILLVEFDRHVAMESEQDAMHNSLHETLQRETARLFHNNPTLKIISI